MEKRATQDNNGPAQDLTPTQEKLIHALLQYSTIKAAATAVGINERTARRYLDEPAFHAAYAKLRETMTEEIRNSMVSLASKAREGLANLMDDPECPHATRVRAYQLALDRGVPVQASQPEQEEKPAGLISLALLPYMTNEELEWLEALIATLEQRKAQAEAGKA